jgi:WD40 repeat protein
MSNTKYLFTGDSLGNLTQYNIEDTLRVTKELGRVHDGTIKALLATPDNKHIYSSDEYGAIKHWRTGTNPKLLEDLGKQHH